MDKKFNLPSNEELAERVYKYCKDNNISYIREDVLISKIVEKEQENTFKMLKENYNLDEKGYGKDKESSDALTVNTGNLLIFSYFLAKRFYDVIDILIDESKAEREIKMGEKFCYIILYITDFEVESMKLVKSSAEIYAKQIYNYCKENNIKCIKPMELEQIFDILEDDKLLKLVQYILQKNSMMKTHIVVETLDLYWIFFLTEDEIQLNKNAELMIKKYAEHVLEYCNENKIEYIEKNELQNILELNDNNEIFDEILDYLVPRHLADEETNEEDNKVYITIYN